MYEEIRTKILKGFLWKFLERFGVLFIQFILQVILARLLTPSLYGSLALMLVFTSLANILVQNGFNTALVQNQEVTDDDYSSVFWLSTAVSCVLYIILFIIAPGIATFYSSPDFIRPFRWFCLILFPGAFNSIQIAILTKQMDFKKLFVSNILSVLVSAFIGISLAISGYGIWSLVLLHISNSFLSSIFMLYSVNWIPTFVFNKNRIKVLFSFGWKLMVSSIIDTLAQDLSGLVIGKFYSISTLGFFNRGKQFPQAGITCVAGAIQSVMLPALSSLQQDTLAAKQIMRNVVVLAAFIVFPFMAVLAGVAKPLILLLLTEKWIDCIIYLQIFCFIYSFWPIHVSNLQAINAMGRSDVFLRLEVIKKSIQIFSLAVGVVLFDSPVSIAMIGMFTTVLASFINAYPNKIFLKYSYSEQMRDISPYFMASIVVFIGMFFISLCEMQLLTMLFLQIVYAVVTYVLFCAICKPYAYILSIEFIKQKISMRGSD